VHLVGFIIRVYHDARSPEHQNHILSPMHRLGGLQHLCLYQGSLTINESGNHLNEWARTLQQPCQDTIFSHRE